MLGQRVQPASHVEVPLPQRADAGGADWLTALTQRAHAAATQRRRYAAVAGIVLLAGAALFNMRHGSARFGWIDFQSFYGAAVDLRAGRDPYASALSFTQGYAPGGNGALFATKSYVYAPIFAVLMMPFTLLPHGLALLVWDLLDVGFLVGAVYAAMRIAGTRPGWGIVLLIAGAAALTMPVHKEWAEGQTDVFMLCMLCFAFWARQTQRPVLAGLLLGLVFPVKPALSLLAVYLLWKREFRVALVAAATAVSLFLLPFAFLAPDVWQHQLTVWHFWSNQFVAFAHNESPGGVLTRLFTVNPVVRPLHVAPHLATALWLGVVAIVAWATVSVLSAAPLRRGVTALLELGLVLEAILLVSPLSEWPYFVLLVVPLTGVVCWLRGRSLAQRRTQLVGVAAISAWLLLCGPAQLVEYRLQAHFATSSHLVADALVVLSPIYLFVLAGCFLLQLHLLAGDRNTTIVGAMRGTLRAAPSLAAGWAGAVAADLRRVTATGGTLRRRR